MYFRFVYTTALDVRKNAVESYIRKIGQLQVGKNETVINRYSAWSLDDIFGIVPLEIVSLV